MDYLYGCIFAYGTQINKNLVFRATIIKYHFLPGNQQAPIFNKSIALGWAMNYMHFYFANWVFINFIGKIFFNNN